MPPETITQMSGSPRRKEKTQEELRDALSERLKSLKPVLQLGIEEYRQATKDGLFEDKDGEETGSG